MFKRKKTGIPQQPSVPPMPNPNPNYKPPVGSQREEKRMFSLEECRYYAPCGLCTFYNTECKEMRKRKSKGKSLCDSCPGKLDDKPHLNIGEADEQHLSPKISIKRKFWKGAVYE